MSVVVSGPRRVYVLLLFCQRLSERLVNGHRGLARAVDAIEVEPADDRKTLCGALRRPVVSLRLRRVFGRRFIGFSLFVVDAWRRDSG